jgi:hypothetical protein
VFHVRLNQLLFIPSSETQQDSRRLWGQPEDGANLVDLTKLLVFDIGGIEDLELDFIGFPFVSEDVFVVRESGVEITEVCSSQVSM